MRFIENHNEIANDRSKLTERDDHAAAVSIELEKKWSASSKWPKQILPKATGQKEEVLVTPLGRSPLRAGRFERVNVTEKFKGEWVAQGAQREFTELWKITRNDGGKWKVLVRYRNAGNELGAAIGDTFELKGDELNLKTVFHKKPIGNWPGNTVAMRFVGDKLRCHWKAGKFSSVVTMACLEKD